MGAGIVVALLFLGSAVTHADGPANPVELAAFVEGVIAQQRASAPLAGVACGASARWAWWAR